MRMTSKADIPTMRPIMRGTSSLGVVDEVEVLAIAGGMVACTTTTLGSAVGVGAVSSTRFGPKRFDVESACYSSQRHV